MKSFSVFILLSWITVFSYHLMAQEKSDSDLLTLDRIYKSKEFKQQDQQPIQWIEGGAAYITIEPSKNGDKAKELIRYDSKSQERSVFVPAEQLLVEGKPFKIEKFTLSPDESKVLFFTNAKQVWRAKTKGDYWIYNFSDQSLKQIGKKFPASSLMFAKFSADNKFVAYVQGFNIYLEDFKSGKTSQLTFDGNKDIINGTFDWAYEEEFGIRDGFSWAPDAQHIAFWQLDASKIGTFFMINNTDSIYSKVIPIQYPKVGEEPSAAKVGFVNTSTKKINWIKLEGGEKENYIPAMQWVSPDLILIQQLNRKQNHLIVWSYQISNDKLQKVYEEKEKTWVDIGYPDVSSNNWGDNDLPIVDHGRAFLRMTETDGWRHVYKVNIASGEKTLLTPGEFDVASMGQATEKLLYFIASPDNSTQRYLFQVSLEGNGQIKQLTPAEFPGINKYNFSPNGRYALHTHHSTQAPKTVRLITLPQHQTIKTLVDNQVYQSKLAKLVLPEVRFSKVTTVDSIELDVRMVLPIAFDSNKVYPVIFHVYGEPWSQVAKDEPIGLWNIMMAQKGYVIIDMDNRGTPCLKGSEWRKSIYRKVGQINTRDQAMAAKEILKRDYLDANRAAVWGWSGGGSMTLNLLFRYPDIYTAGVSVAPVADQLTYDNIYQERYMGLPQENLEDFIQGSPITYAKNLKAKLLLVHGTGDDNVHYQNAERLVNELIEHNKQFRMMAYPNRSHGIKEGANTTRHLYTLLTNYFLEVIPPNTPEDTTHSTRRP